MTTDPTPAPNPQANPASDSNSPPTPSQQQPPKPGNPPADPTQNQTNPTNSPASKPAQQTAPTTPTPLDSSLDPNSAQRIQSQTADPLTTPAANAPAQPVGGQPTSPLQADDELSEDQFITGGDDHSFILNIPLPPHPKTIFDEKKFSQLLASSISLTKKEKQNIIKSIPNLSQYQIDELTKIFQNEQAKIEKVKMKPNCAPSLKQLENKSQKDWHDLETQAKAAQKKAEDLKSAETIRKNLGLQ